MDMRRELLKEHSKQQAQKIVSYIGKDPERFTSLVNLFLEGPYRVTQRAAWPLNYCVENHPTLIKPHLKRILNHLNKPGIHDSVKRNVMRFLQFIEIPVRNQGQVASRCMNYLQDRAQPIAIRCFSMTVMAKIANQNHELKRELRLAIEDLIPSGSPGILSRAKKVLRELQKD
jgi:hypothetical protein